MSEPKEVTELKKALLCLFIECPKPVAEDVGEKAEVVIELLNSKLNHEKECGCNCHLED